MCIRDSSIGLHSDGRCACGRGEETVGHFLLSCQNHTEASKQLVSDIKKSYHTQAKPTLARILNSDNRSFIAVAAFLEKVARFDPP